MTQLPTRQRLTRLLNRPLPLLGEALPMALRPLEFLSAQRAKAAVNEISLAGRRAFIVNDPELVREMLVNRAREFVKEGPLYEISSKFVGFGLAISEGPFHKRQRRMVQPAFATAALPDYQTAMQDAVHELVAGWDHGVEIDLLTQLNELTVAVIGKSLYPGGFPPQTARDIVWAVAVASKGIGWRSLTPGWLHGLPTPETRDFVRAQQILHDVADDILTSGRNAPLDDRLFMSRFITARGQNGESMTEEELRDEVVTLFSAGSATAATTLAWALYLVGRHDDVASALRSELSILDGRAPNVSELTALPLLQRVVTEVLRLYPPAWLLPRITHEETRLGSQLIPAGVHVFFSPYSIHRDPRYFSDPDAFDPDRWEPVGSTKVRDVSYLPFGAGIHQCVGNNFALTEVSIALGFILQRWSIETAHEVRPANRAVLEPRGMRVTVRQLAATAQREEASL